MRKKSYLLSAMILLFAFSTSLFGQTVWDKYTSTKENNSDAYVGTFPAPEQNAALPDPFMLFNGQRITDKSQWWEVRSQTLALFERYIYGAKPIPQSTTGTVTQSQITVNVNNGAGRTASWTATINAPTNGAARPWPVVFTFGSGVSNSFLQSRGVAVVTIPFSNLGNEGASRNAKTGYFYTVHPDHNKTGSLGAWAWGVSRMIDVIQNSDGSVLKWDAVGVTGCSRHGKGAFVCSILDQRIALALPMESGTGGMASMRVAWRDKPFSGTDGSQSPSSAYGEARWLGDDFSSFINSQSEVDNLPVDMHQAIGLMAPRGFCAVYKTASSAGKWLNVSGSHVSAKAGAEIYKALGFAGNFCWLNFGTASHCAWVDGYNTYVSDFIDIFLHKTKQPGTVALFPNENIEAARAATATAPAIPANLGLSSLLTWTTPTLTGDLPGEGIVYTGFSLSTSTSHAGAATFDVSPAPTLPGDRYEEGTVVSVTVVPNDGWAFTGWSGDASGTQKTITLTMDDNKAIVANFLPTKDSDNLIKNGNFASTTNWQYNVGSSYGNGQGSFTVLNNEATLTITAQGAEAYSPQLVQHGIPLLNGYKYSFEMDVRAASDRTFQVVFQMGSSPWTTYSQKDFDITTETQKITHEFEMTYPSDAGIQLSFNTGLAQQGNNAAPTLYLKNASLIYLGFPSGINEVSEKTSNLRASVENAAVNVNFTATRSGATELKLYSVTGTLVESAQMQTVAGENYSYTFSQGYLPTGFYVVWVNCDGSVERAKVLMK